MYVSEAHHHGHHNAHRKVDALTVEISETSLDLDTEGTNMNPRGAILALTMGKRLSTFSSIVLLFHIIYLHTPASASITLLINTFWFVLTSRPST